MRQLHSTVCNGTESTLSVEQSHPMVHFIAFLSMACLDVPPVLSITQLEDLVRKEFFQTKNSVLGTDVYKVYIVGGLTNVSTKATAKMRLIVITPDEFLQFYPGTATEPNAEKRLIYLFFGKAVDGLTDMSNKFAGNPLQIGEKICTACVSLQPQNSLVFADSKNTSDLNDFLTNFSYENVERMKSLRRQAADILISEGTLDNYSVGMLQCSYLLIGLGLVGYPR